MLSLRAVNHYYGNQHTLWNVNFELESGSCTSLVGLQGMGKSTLVNCIAGYQPVESGSIVWQGISGPPHDLLKLSPRSRTALGIGYVPQDRRIFSQMTVEENLHIAMMAGSEGTSVLGNDLYDLLPELYPLRQVKGAALNEDAQYQLALAGALVTHPKLLLLDEPTRGRDQGFVHRLGDFLLRLNRELGLTVLLAEQQLSFIRRVASRFCLLYQGRCVAQGQIDRLDSPLLAQFMAMDEAP